MESETAVGVSHWSSIFTLAVFVLTSMYKSFETAHLLKGLTDFSSPLDAAVIFPSRIPLPCFELSSLAKILAEKQLIKPQKSSCRRKYLPVDFTTVPLFAVLLLLATKCIDGSDLRRGLFGEGGVKPLSIMALFISLVPSPFPSYVWNWNPLLKLTGLSNNFPRRSRAV